jgi:hypothetical protein
MDIVSQYTFNDSPSLIITHSSGEFIRDRVKLSFPGEPQEDAREHAIFLDERYHTAFFDRLYQDINNGQSYLVLVIVNSKQHVFKQQCRNF